MSRMQNSCGQKRRRGRSLSTTPEGRRDDHIRVASLMVNSDWTVERIARAFSVSRPTCYVWRDLALGYDGPVADELRRLAGRGSAN